MPVTAALEGKTAVVTGASSGIGRAIAERLGTSGARVFLVGRTAEPMEASKARIEEAGGKADVAVFDVRDPDAVHSLIDRAAEETGRLDVMVNSAGLSYPGPILEGRLDHWREMFEVNVLALLVGSQAAIEAMRRCGNGGHVVNVSSIAAQRRDSGVYGATKHAVNAITSTLREELQDEEIRVVCVMPGAVATNFGRHFSVETMNALGAVIGERFDFHPGDRLPDDSLAKAQEAMARGMATADDVAEAVLYAVSVPSRVNIAEIVVRPAKQLHFQ